MVGQHLSERSLKHGDLVLLSRVLGKSPRTLRSWRSREGRSGSPGQPAHSTSERARVLAECRRVWRELPAGHDGWRSVCAVLERERVAVPVRLVQRSVRMLKAQRCREEEQRVEENRVHVEVLAKNALWALDQTQLSAVGQEKTTGLVVRECVASHALGLSVGPPAAGADVVRLLWGAAQERGAWPFVLQMDNGSENNNRDVRELLDRQRVIALWNVPHTPQHNLRAERQIGALKRAGGFPSRWTRGAEATQRPVCTQELGVPAKRASLCARLFAAWALLDARTPRPALGGLTPLELDRIAPQADDHACRARFYAEVCGELQRIAGAPENARARRKLEREAIWCALERHGLVTRTRGGMPVPTVNAEGIS